MLKFLYLNFFGNLLENCLKLLTEIRVWWSWWYPTNPIWPYQPGVVKTQNILTLLFLDFCLPPRIFWHVFEKNCAARCAAIALGSLWTPHWPPTVQHSTKIIFHMHVTFDLWWLYINVDLWYYHLSILINVSLSIYLLICNSIHTPFVRHPVQNERGKYAAGKVLGKILKWIKHNFFCLAYIILFILYKKKKKKKHQFNFF